MAHSARTFTNPIVDNTNTPDPSVVYKDGFYYFTFTDADAGANQIQIWKSPILDFHSANPNLVKSIVFTPPANSDYSTDLWAPELQYIDGSWYIYFAANPNSDYTKQKMHVLKLNGNDPMTDTWEHESKIADSQNDYWAIDGTVMEKGSFKYFVWSGWEGRETELRNKYANEANTNGDQLCWDTQYGNSNKGQHIYQRLCDGTDSQKFFFEAHGNYIAIRQESSGFCIDIDRAFTSNGAVALLWDCTYADNQLFKKIDYDTGSNASSAFSLKPKHVEGLNRCLEIAGASTQANSKVQQWDCYSGNHHQMFYYGHGSQATYIAEMSSPTALNPNKRRVKISEPEYLWEKNGGDGLGGSYVQEGQEVVHHDNEIILFYSASGSWTPDYCIGALTLHESQDPLNPSNWVKLNGCLLERNDNASVYGTGHASFIKSPDNSQYWVIYHANTNVNDGWQNRKARAQEYFFNTNKKPVFSAASGANQLLNAPSGEFLPGQFYNVFSKLCLRKEQISTTNTTSVMKQRDCHSIPLDTWDIALSTNYPGKFRVVSLKEPGKCFKVVNNTNVTLASCQDISSQVFESEERIESGESIGFHLINARNTPALNPNTSGNTNKCLEIKGASQASGGELGVWDCTIGFHHMLFKSK
ncbi:family 43 glycosylhydrolase [Candidatus Albibeggiatoa sp. nov. BB20]|uniref:family 43 glycosylhydrolase n=1 Tax=Candidatus Albibeggiatoa sp. nov. BB20 TaxID=3162723 RepID=UPI0033658246